MEEKCLNNVYMRNFLKWLSNYGAGRELLENYELKLVENPPHTSSVTCMLKNKMTGLPIFIKTDFYIEQEYPNLKNDMIITFITLYNLIRVFGEDTNILKKLRMKKIYPIIAISFNRTHTSPVLEISLSVGGIFIPDMRKIRVKVSDGVYVMNKKLIPFRYEFKVNITEPDNILKKKAVSMTRFIVDIEMLSKININYLDNWIGYPDIRNFSYLLSKFMSVTPSTVIIPHVSVKESAFIDVSRNLFNFIKTPQGLQRIIFSSLTAGNEIVVNGEIVINNTNMHLCQLKNRNTNDYNTLFRIYNTCVNEIVKKIEKLGLQTAV